MQISANCVKATTDEHGLMLNAVVPSSVLAALLAVSDGQRFGFLLGAGNLVRELGDVGLLPRMLNRHANHAAGIVEFDENVLVQVAYLSDLSVTEVNQQSISVLKVPYLHFVSRYLRSKNALWTVSLSSRRITRKYFPPASAILAQRRIRPSACSDSASGLAMTRSIHSSLIAARSGRFRMCVKYCVTFTAEVYLREPRESRSGRCRSGLSLCLSCPGYAGTWYTESRTVPSIHLTTATTLSPCLGRDGLPQVRSTSALMS